MSVGRNENSDLEKRAQCRACLNSFPRNNFDWSKLKEIKSKTGLDDSWGCYACNEPKVGTEEISYKNAK